jgi:hypothetical protein
MPVWYFVDSMPMAGVSHRVYNGAMEGVTALLCAAVFVVLMGGTAIAVRWFDRYMSRWMEP